jgi:hypothetical protein
MIFVCFKALTNTTLASLVGWRDQSLLVLFCVILLISVSSSKAVKKTFNIWTYFTVSRPSMDIPISEARAKFHTTYRDENPVLKKFDRAYEDSLRDILRDEDPISIRCLRNYAESQI